VKVIGHDGECVQFKFPSGLGGFEPLLPYNFAALIFLHLVINDLTKDTLFSERAERHKVRARQRVVIAAQSDGTAVVNPWVVFHGSAERHLAQAERRSALHWPLPQLEIISQDIQQVVSTSWASMAKSGPAVKMDIERCRGKMRMSYFSKVEMSC
jgi:hypothetical protein